jgi:exportin-1
MAILRLLSEEVFDYSAEQMTQAKTKNLKTTMCQEFSAIFQLCSEVLQMAEEPSLIKETLETLLRFLNWIPLGYIFETPIIETLRSRFLEVPEFRNVTMKCLTEIGSLQVNQAQYDEKLVEMFTSVMTTVAKIIPLNTDLRAIYPSSNARDQEFIQNLALFLCNFFTPHVKASRPSKPLSDVY